MNENIRNELSLAKKHYKSRNYTSSKEKYEKIYQNNREEFSLWDKLFYAWSIYQCNMKEASSQRELVEAGFKIIGLLEQSDCSDDSACVCVYATAVLKVAHDYFRKQDYMSTVEWLENLNPDFLSKAPFKSDGGILIPSQLERYYAYMSKSLLSCYEYTRCINVSREGLLALDDFVSHDVWLKWRIARSLKELGEFQKSIESLEEIISQHGSRWFFLKELAENYFYLEDYDKALKYALSAALEEGDVDKKKGVFILIINLLSDNEIEGEIEMHEKLVEAIEYGEDYIGLEMKLRDYWESLI